MGKVKIKKKSTIIDMTAMSDVTVLLLTFFMLTSTFLQKEPVQVITPPSVSDEKVPDEKLVQILVGPTGSVYMNLTGTRDTTVLTTEKFKEEVLSTAYGLYQNDNPSAKGLSESQIKEFAKLGTFGVPMKEIGDWINMSVDERDEVLKQKGIPIEDNSKDNPNSRKNEFQKYWLPAIASVMHKKDLDKDLRSGKSIAIKAGQNSPFHFVHMVMENLQTAHMNKFILMTSFKSEKDR